MTEYQREDYDEQHCDYDGSCYYCGGGGWVVVCIDDLCRGAGECMHGRGDAPCPNCNKGMRKDPC